MSVCGGYPSSLTGWTEGDESTNLFTNRQVVARGPWARARAIADHGVTMGLHRVFHRLPTVASETVRREALFWAAQAVFWSIPAIGMTLLLRREVFPDLPADVSIAPLIAIRLAFVVAASTVLRELFRVPAVRRLPAVPTVAVIIVACGGMALLEPLLVTPATAAILPHMTPHLQRATVKLTFNVVSALLIWSLGYRFLTGFVVISRAENLARQSRQRATDLELALRSSELARLGEQVQPHFLFNALTAVVACRHDPDAVSEVTGSLAEYLRFCLATTDCHAPLDRELDAIEHLLVVHQARLRSAIECRIDSTPEARVLPVPPMLVGPLVENALKYGARTSPPPLTIAIDAGIEDGRLRIAVVNSGTWVDRATDRPGGTGLANLRRRLDLAGLTGATVTVAPGDGTVTGEITLPVAACLAAAEGARSTPPRERPR